MAMFDLVKVSLLLAAIVSLSESRVHRATFVPKQNHIRNDTSYRDVIGASSRTRGGGGENEVLLDELEDAAEVMDDNTGEDLDAEWEDVESLPLMQTRPEPAEEMLLLMQGLAEEIAGLRGQLSTLKFQNHLIYKQLKKTPYKCSMPVHQPVIKSAALRLEEKPVKTCPPDFIENKETRSCYKFGTDRITWRMAREKCRAQDADLATINTRREQKYLAQTARENPTTRHCDFWAGATDAGSEGKWYWIDNKRPLTYSNWNHNEPNNGNGDEHCMHMLWVFNWAWNDARCNYDNACYICEAKLRN